MEFFFFVKNKLVTDGVVVNISGLHWNQIQCQQWYGL